jgi:hypothetical protein
MASSHHFGCQDYRAGVLTRGSDFDLVNNSKASREPLHGRRRPGVILGAPILKPLHGTLRVIQSD